jgi:hypothetical protein
MTFEDSTPVDGRHSSAADLQQSRPTHPIVLIWLPRGLLDQGLIMYPDVLTHSISSNGAAVLL